jgi:tripartite-type tricarboxylate transporter receptor subunit TctC
MTTRRKILSGLAAVAAMPKRALAQATYPTRPVRIIVPFAPGGGADIVSRLLAPHMQQQFGQSVIVENRSGAAGRIGTALVAHSDRL